jgi:hypothetical protein
MDALVRVDDPDAARSLLDWFGYEDELRGRVQPVLKPIEPGDMGALWDALRVQLGRDGAVAALVRSIAGWLRNREQYKGSAVKIEIQVGDAKATVDLDRINAEVDNVNELINTLASALRDSSKR